MKILITSLFLTLIALNSYAADLVGTKVILQKDVVLGNVDYFLGEREIRGNRCSLLFYNWQEIPQTIKAGTVLVVNEVNYVARRRNNYRLTAQGLTEVIMNISGDDGYDNRKYKITIELGCETKEYLSASLAKLVALSPKNLIRAYEDYFRIEK